MVPAAGGAPRELFRSRPGSIEVAKAVWSRDGKRLYMKAFDSKGRVAVWTIDAMGGEPRLFARLDDAARSSSRPDFAVDATRLFFPLADRQSDIYVAELVRKR